MKNILKNKKLLLLILSIFLILILFSNYLKTVGLTENKLKKEKIIEKAAPVDRAKIEPKIKDQEKQKEIESTALIKEIRDPFRAEIESKEDSKKEREDLAAAKKIKLKTGKDLIYLEKNIIADNTAAESKIKADITAKTKYENTTKTKIKAEKSIKDFRLPFKLLGIIKNADNSSALFLYQGQSILKKEKEKIDIFKIEEINNKNLIISCQDQRRKIHLWEEKNNEN